MHIGWEETERTKTATFYSGVSFPQRSFVRLFTATARWGRDLRRRDHPSSHPSIQMLKNLAGPQAPVAEGDRTADFEFNSSQWVRNPTGRSMKETIVRSISIWSILS